MSEVLLYGAASSCVYHTSKGVSKRSDGLVGNTLVTELPGWYHACYRSHVDMITIGGRERERERNNNNNNNTCVCVCVCACVCVRQREV